jgi:P27 family predicted phage terminase small subunit
MPTPLKNSDNMRKHLTTAERKARETAEDELQRDARVILRAPDWLSEDARKVWDATRRKLKGIQLLDNLDTELLAVYCDAVANYRAASKFLKAVDEEGNPRATLDDVKSCQAWARIVFSSSDKLGLSPTARARLAKKKAEVQPPSELEQLLDGDWNE